VKITEFVDRNYLHFNAATLAEAARAYSRHVDGGGAMLVTLAGAMSTAELGKSLAEMIRRGKVDAICCTGANLEEDVFNLVAHDSYRRIPDWRHLTPEQERELAAKGLNRVTDTCIPEEEAMRVIEAKMVALWERAERSGERFFPHEFTYLLLREQLEEADYQIDPRDSWLHAACEANLPIFVPGWEDSTLGNMYVARVLAGTLSSYGIVRSGLETMGALAEWYLTTTMGATEPNPSTGPDQRMSLVVPAEEAKQTVGFFQIGGGIAGDFPICVVPMIHQDLQQPCPIWAYFCQISDSTTSYGSYSGAVPAEKITWGKLDVDTPMFVIESDATIVAPLMFGYILDW
jgi:deoxyhypusine synthase